MCGIVGYVGPREAEPILIEALRRLEYRGYDSAGIATITGDRMHLRKRAGRVGGDPGAITDGNGKGTAPYGTPPPEMVAAVAEPKKGGFLGNLFRGK